MIYNIKNLKIPIAELPEWQIKTNRRQWVAEWRGLRWNLELSINKLNPQWPAIKGRFHRKETMETKKIIVHTDTAVVAQWIQLHEYIAYYP